MKKQISISKFEALNEQELQNTNGGIVLLIYYALPALIGIAIYGAFMDGYNDGMAAAHKG
jgi:lactobin A/cerein 7B family class IIb bacteriocin